MKINRMHKVNELIQHALAERMGELRSDREGIVTVTGVETNPDLRSAVVWLSLFGEVDEAELEDLYPELREAMPGLDLKYIPKLEFRIDRSGDEQERLDRIFREMGE